MTETKESRKYFGTDGIRGVANVPPLEPETLMRLGRAIAAYFLKDSKRHSILIGKDTRLSGYMIETSLAAGISSMGANVLLVGPLPTPGIAYLTRSMRADAGVMISASHNPYEDNGVKIFGEDGFKLPDNTEREIEALLEDGALSKKNAEAANVGKAKRIEDAAGRYIAYLKSCFPRELSLTSLRIGFDCANGAAYQTAPMVADELGAEVISRGVSPNGKNINAGFGSLYPKIVAKLVSENNLDIGVALDGDADRAIFVDEKGRIHDGDVVLAICALDMQQRGLLKTSSVVATTMSNLGLERCLAKYGIDLLRVGVGDRYVLEKMLETGANLGGEQSGHTIFTDISTSGDGTLTALRIFEIMARTGKPLSELASVFEHFPQKLINLAVRKKPELQNIPSIAKILEEKEKTLEGKGRVLVRYSGTENKVRIMVEADDEEACAQHASDIAEVIEREIGSP